MYVCMKVQLQCFGVKTLMRQAIFISAALFLKHAYVPKPEAKRKNVMINEYSSVCPLTLLRLILE